jgi:hypothetical protein
MPAVMAGEVMTAGIDEPVTQRAILDLQERHSNLARDGELGPRSFVELLRHVERSNARKHAAESGAPDAGDAAGEPAPVDRAVQLAREYGTGLALARTRGGPAPKLRAAFSPSRETGEYDADAIEVAAVLSIPHRTDMPMTRKILERDGDILYAAIGAQAKTLADEKRRQKRKKSSRKA